jgi:hypothetical protein
MLQHRFGREVLVTPHGQVVTYPLSRKGQTMVAVREITWEEASAPDFEQTTRQVWREAVAEIAEKAKATLPECNGRVDSAVKLVLAGDVELLADGTARVASQSHGNTTYVVCNGTCECKDYAKAPSNWCKHRIAAGLYKRAQALVQRKLNGASNGHAASDPAPAQPEAPTAPLPEAPASVNVHLELAGRQVQLTLRDSDEGRLLARLDAILQRFPAVTKPADATPQCPTHGTMKPSTKGKGWYCPRKLADGSWCRGK